MNGRYGNQRFYCSCSRGFYRPSNTNANIWISLISVPVHITSSLGNYSTQPWFIIGLISASYIHSIAVDDGPQTLVKAFQQIQKASVLCPWHAQSNSAYSVVIQIFNPSSESNVLTKHLNFSTSAWPVCFLLTIITSVLAGFSLRPFFRHRSWLSSQSFSCTIPAYS